MNIKFGKIIITTIIVSVFIPFFVLSAEEAEIRNIFFPTDRSLEFGDSFGDDRYGHSHEGIDIMGPHMTPLYAAVDGQVSHIVIPEASWGYAVVLRDSDGYTYHYLHMNNDNPGTDDGKGGVDQAYAPGIVRGAQVSKGQLVGWMGDSGNAESVGNHLHFEIRKDGVAINPYQSLLAALKPGGYDPGAVSSVAISINNDRNIPISFKPTACASDTLIKLVDSDSVYYCGADGKRYVFPNDRVYFSWYEDFSEVIEITLEQIAEIPLGGNVTYKPGVKMVKIQSVPKVYAVDRGGVLRWVRSIGTAEALYGENWNKMIDDIPDSFFMNYQIGEPIL